MEKIFFQVLNMSLVSGYVITFLLLVRPIFKKASSRFCYALWGVALFRLLCPLSVGSLVSLVPIRPNTVSIGMLYEQNPRIHSGIASFDSAVNQFLPAGTSQGSVNPLQIHAYIGGILWIGGMIVLMGYGIVSLVLLKYRLRKARPFPGSERVLLMDGLETPFVLGIIRPRIYLPSVLGEKEREYVLLHETAHIKRFDHIIRLAAYTALCIHWFNPLVWLAFWLSGKDMELSCDENAVRGMELEERKGYSSALLRLSTEKKIKCPTPLAFGEGDVKGRIKSILSYQKPVVWVSALALAAASILCLGLAINPKEVQTYKLSAEDLFIQKLVETVVIRDGKISFTIPEGIPAGSQLHINVRGRLILPDGSDVSLHLFENVETWAPGAYYEDTLFDSAPDGWEVDFESFLEDKNGVQTEKTGVMYGLFPQKNSRQLIFVNGKLYTAAYEDVSEMVAREAETSEYDSPYIGEIASSIGESETPAEELQSNFGCIGSEVVFNGSGIAVNIDGKWMQFNPVSLTLS